MLALVFVGGATGGCGGERFTDYTSYEDPNWTPEGLIYCLKATTHYRKYWGAIGGEYSENLGTDYYYVTMTTDGINETTLPYTSYPHFSPLGTYVALISGETISIVRRSDNVRVYNFSPTTESISELDWGPDEGKLVYLKNRGGINVVNVDGTGDLSLAASGETISWRYGNKIAFEYQEGLSFPLAVINYDGGSRINLGSESVSDPCVSSSSTNKIYGKNSTSYGYINVGVATPEFISEISGFNGYKPRLSPNANKIVYGAFRDSGIWLIDVDGSNLKQVK